jgi:hypothetical protein
VGPTCQHDFIFLPRTCKLHWRVIDARDSIRAIDASNHSSWTRPIKPPSPRPLCPKISARELPDSTENIAVFRYYRRREPHFPVCLVHLEPSLWFRSLSFVLARLADTLSCWFASWFEQNDHRLKLLSAGASPASDSGHPRPPHPLKPRHQVHLVTLSSQVIFLPLETPSSARNA